MSSSLPGGPSAKAGLIYEAFYGIRAMLSIIQSSAEAITIEPPHEDGCEFFVEADGSRQYWQVKRQSIGQNWTLHRMHDEGVLSSFLQYLRQGFSCYFASMTEAQELRLLAEHARNAKDSHEDFKTKFLNHEQRHLFQRLLKYWSDVSEAEALKLLQGIYFEGAQEMTLQNDLAHMMRALFDVPPARAEDCLFRFYLESVHLRLNREQILAHLAMTGIKLRLESILSSDIQQLRSVTDQYVAGQRAKLIGGKAIPRSVTEQILQKLQSSDFPVDLALSSSSGGGKSACLLQIIERLKCLGMPVLAFRLDTLNPCPSSMQLGQQLGLRESPIVVFAKAFAGKRAIVILDQLDVVSSASGRHPEFFDTVARLVEEIRGSRISCDLSLLVACREFDLSNDPRFRRLFMTDQWLHNLGFLSVEEVTAVVAEQGGTSSLLTKGQLDLLQLPQNLYLFIESGLVKRPALHFRSQKDLLDLFWEGKTNEIFKKDPRCVEPFNSLVETVSKEMSDTQQLSVSRSKLQSFPAALLDAACSLSILSRDKQRIAFLHESLFDYVFARSTTAHGQDFAQFLETDLQLLFRRAQLRQVLIFLRDDGFERYLKMVKKLITSPRIRAHLKLLTLQLLAGLPDPTKDEFIIFLPFIEQEFAHRRSGTKNPNALCRQAFEQFFHSKGLFATADAQGCLVQWLHSGDKPLEEFMTAYFRRQCPWHANRIAQFLQPFEIDKRWDNRFRYVFQFGALHFGDIEDGREFFDSFLRALDRGVLDEVRGSPSTEDFFAMFHSLGRVKPKLYAEILSRWLSRQIERSILIPGTDEVEISFYGHARSDDLIESAKTDPEAFLSHVLPVLLRAAQVSARDGNRKYKRDTICEWRRINDRDSIGEASLKGCEIALKVLAENGERHVRPFINLLADKALDVANVLLLCIYGARPDVFADEAVRAVLLDPERLYVGYSDSPFWTSRTLVRKCSRYCSQELFK